MGSDMAKTPEAAPTTPDPIEIAMEAEASGEAPRGVAHRVLAKQEQLIGWQIASERAGFALKVLTGVAGVAVAGALAVMAWQASRADGVILDPFTVPPALAAEGKFKQADQYAPNWGRNHLKWGEALAKLGRKDAALAQWRIAGGLDLTADERVRLKAHGV